MIKAIRQFIIKCKNGYKRFISLLRWINKWRTTLVNKFNGPIDKFANITISFVDAIVKIVYIPLNFVIKVDERYELTKQWLKKQLRVKFKKWLKLHPRIGLTLVVLKALYNTKPIILLRRLIACLWEFIAITFVIILLVRRIILIIIEYTST